MLTYTNFVVYGFKYWNRWMPLLRAWNGNLPMPFLFAEWSSDYRAGMSHVLTAHRRCAPQFTDMVAWWCGLQVEKSTTYVRTIRHYSWWLNWHTSQYFLNTSLIPLPPLPSPPLPSFLPLAHSPASLNHVVDSRWTFRRRSHQEAEEKEPTWWEEWWMKELKQSRMHKGNHYIFPKTNSRTVAVLTPWWRGKSAVASAQMSLLSSSTERSKTPHLRCPQRCTPHWFWWPAPISDKEKMEVGLRQGWHRSLHYKDFSTYRCARIRTCARVGLCVHMYKQN